MLQHAYWKQRVLRLPDKLGKVRPPTLLAQTAITGAHGTSRSLSPSSKRTSRPSSAYRAVHEAAMSRKALLQAQLEADSILAPLCEDKAECDREHQAIAEEIEAVQNELRISANRHAQWPEMQAAERNAMGHRIIEMKDLLIQRKLGMELQLQEMCSQFQTMGAVLKNIQPKTENIIPMNLLLDSNDPPP